MNTVNYRELLRHPKWQEKRLRVMDRAGFKCQSCGTKEVTLNVHHRYYLSGANPWEYPDAALMCLCEPCHEKHHKNMPQVDAMKPWKIDAIPPHNRDAELAVLGGLLFDPTMISAVPGLKPRDFYFDLNRRIYSDMQLLSVQGFDSIIIASRLESSPDWRHGRGGVATVLKEAIGLVPNGARVREHAMIVLAASNLRRMFHAAITVLHRIHDGWSDSFEIEHLVKYELTGGYRADDRDGDY